jgi:hypothetical protein
LKLQEAEEEEEKSDFLASSMKRHDRAGKPQTQKSKCWTSRLFVVLLSSFFFFFFFFGVYSKNLGRPSAPLGTTRGPAR